MKPPLVISSVDGSSAGGRLEVHPRVVFEHEPQLAAALEDVVAERPPQPREECAECFARVGRRRIGPQQVNQLVAAACTSTVDDQVCEQQATLTAGRNAPSAPPARRRAGRTAGSGSCADPNAHRRVFAGFLQGCRRRLRSTRPGGATCRTPGTCSWRRAGSKSIWTTRSCVSSRWTRTRRSTPRRTSRARSASTGRPTCRTRSGATSSARRRSARCSARAGSRTRTWSSSTATATTGSRPTRTGT